MLHERFVANAAARAARHGGDHYMGGRPDTDVVAAAAHENVVGDSKIRIRHLPVRGEH